jgi:hypothetical protein
VAALAASTRNGVRIEGVADVPRLPQHRDRQDPDAERRDEGALLEVLGRWAVSPLEQRPKTVHGLLCDGCQKWLTYEGWPDHIEWFFEVDELLVTATRAGWTHEGEGAEERWHCPECPPLGAPKAEPGKGQEVLPV